MMIRARASELSPGDTCKNDGQDGEVRGLLLEPARAVIRARGGVVWPTVFVMGDRAGSNPAISRISSEGVTLLLRPRLVLEYVFVF